MALGFIELRLHSPLGTFLLPHFTTATFDVKYNDVGAIDFSYPTTAAASLGLKDQSIVSASVGLPNGNTREVDRYVIEACDDAKISDGEKISTFKGRGSLALLDDAIVYPSNWPVTSPPGHEFVQSNLGTIFRTLIQRAQSRGALSNLDVSSFTGVNDSLGAVWAHTHSQVFSNGTKYLAVIQEFMQRGFADAWIDYPAGNPRLRIANGGTRGVHVPISSLEIRAARNSSEMTISTQSSDSASVVLIEGEQGTALQREDATARSLIGRRKERHVSQGGIADSGILTLLADAELSQYGRIPTEESVGLSSLDVTPFQDFDIADWVWVRYDSASAPVERRVRQIAVSVSENRDITVGVTLNSILMENDIALQRKVAAYTSSGGAYGSQPNVNAPDQTTPNKPMAVSVTSGAYSTSTGETQSAVSVNWVPPTTNTDGSAVTDLAGFETQWVYSSLPSEPVPNADWSSLYPTTESPFQHSPFVPGATIRVRVRAKDTSGHVSDWAPDDSGVSHNVAIDSIPPPQPSKPMVESRMGSIVVTWDGRTKTGAEQPIDFDYAELHGSLVANFTPQKGDPATMTMRHIFGRDGGSVSVSGLAYGSTWFFKIIAVDTSRNASIPSDASEPIVVKPLVDTDVIGRIISGANIVKGSVNAAESIIGDTITGALIQGLAINAGHLQANSIDSTKIRAGAIQADALSVGTRPVSLLMNSNFEDVVLGNDGLPVTPNVPSSWIVYYTNGGTASLGVESGSSKISGTKSAKVTLGGSADTRLMHYPTGNFPHIPVREGATYFVTCSFRSSVATAGKQLILTFHTSTTTASGPYGISEAGVTWQAVYADPSVPANTVVVLQGSFTVPIGHSIANVSLYIPALGNGASVYVDEFALTPSVPDDQITEIGAGKIKTGVVQASTSIIIGNQMSNHLRINGGGDGTMGKEPGIAAWKNGFKTFYLNSITGDATFSGKVTAAIVEASTINGNTINGNTITGNTINGNTITGNTVTGGTVTGTTVSGTSIIGGTITGAVIAGGSVTSTTAGGTNDVSLYNGAISFSAFSTLYNGEAEAPPPQNRPATINVFKGMYPDTGGGLNAVLGIASTKITTSSMISSAEFGQGWVRLITAIDGGDYSNVFLMRGSGTYISSNGTIDIGTTGNRLILRASNFIQIDQSIGPDPNNAYRPFINIDWGDTFKTYNNRIYSFNTHKYPETSASRMLGVGVEGLIKSVSSLRAHKLNIREIPIDSIRGLLNIPVSEWFDKTNTERYALALDETKPQELRAALLRDTERLARVPGLIAEDVEEHSPLFATYNPDGSLVSVAYDRIGVAWIPLVRELYDTVQTQADRISQLEETLWTSTSPQN